MKKIRWNLKNDEQKKPFINSVITSASCDFQVSTLQEREMEDEKMDEFVKISE